MKKLYSFFLFGELILFSIIFSQSLYEVYGLSHIGDTKLAGYKIDKASSEMLGNVYDYLMKQDANIQIIKMPLSQEETDVINYEIYHTNVSSIFHFQGLSDTQYSYFMLSKDDFIDGTGVFYTNLGEKDVQKMADVFSIKIDDYASNSYTSIKTILYANGMDVLILLFISFIVMLIYVISRNKENAVKALLGFSKHKIVLSRIKETFLIELVSVLLVIIGNIIHYGVIGKLSLFYVIFLLGFMLLISCVNVGLVFLTCIGLRRIHIDTAIKNQRYSHGLDYSIQIGKIVLFLLVSVAVSESVHYHAKISEVEKDMENYKELNDFYSSYGFNSDEYDKLCNNNALYLQQAKQVKHMYQENMNHAYVMQDCVLTALDEGMDEEDFYGMSKEKLFESYKNNYIVANEKYLQEYIDCKIISGDLNCNDYTLLVPLMYQDQEKELKTYYKLVLEDKILADSYYGEQSSVSISENDINIVYIDNDYSVKLLSDYQYNSNMNIEIKHPIIVLDTGGFSSIIYMDMLSNCQLAYKETNKGDFSAMLEKYGLERLFSARTMLAPFMEEISGYQFVLQQSELFIALFTLTLLFIIYISNHVHVNVHAKDYGVKCQMGYNSFRILKSDIAVTLVLLVFSLVLKLIDINIYGYLSFVIIDLVILYVLYRINILQQLYKILNGGC